MPANQEQEDVAGRHEVRDVSEAIGVKAPDERAEELAGGRPHHAQEERVPPGGCGLADQAEGEGPKHETGRELSPEGIQPVERERSQERRGADRGGRGGDRRRRDRAAHGIVHSRPHLRQRTRSQVAGAPSPTCDGPRLPPDSRTSNFAYAPQPSHLERSLRRSASPMIAP